MPTSLPIIDKMLKQRRESIAQFEKGGRQDLADNGTFRGRRAAGVYAAALSEAEIDAEIAAAIQSTGAKAMADMGKVMAMLKTKARRQGRHGESLRAGEGKARRVGGLALTRARAGSSADMNLRRLIKTVRAGNSDSYIVCAPPAVKDYDSLRSRCQSLVADSRSTILIPQSFIQDLLHRVDIVDVIERYVPLKKRRRQLRGLLPVPRREDAVVYRQPDRSSSTIASVAAPTARRSAS